MDIEVIIRKTVIFAGLLAFVFGVFSAATLFVQKVLVNVGVNEIWTYIISLFLIVLGYDPIRNLLVNLTDRYLFQKKYDYQKLLKDASKGMSRIESLDHLMKLVVHFITMKMRVKNVGVLTRQDGADMFRLYCQRGYEKNYLDYRLDGSSALIAYLHYEKEPLDIERVKEGIESGGERRRKKQTKKGVAVAAAEYDYSAIKAQMEELEAVCCVPSFLGHELRNILVLGEKKSGDFYTDEDLNVLYTLAQESAIAIENARLFDEAIAKTRELERINEQLEYSKELLIKALKETEVANKQLQDTQAQLIHEQKMATLGRLAASVGHEVNNPLTILSMNVSRAILKYRKNPDTRVQEILDLFDKMEQNIGRIKAVVNTLTGLLKRSEKGKFEPLSLKLILEETLPLVQFQTYLDNLTGTEVEFIVPSDLPLVRGDLERLQEVFLNLFINAYHAMEGRRDRRIRVTAELDPQNPQMIDIHFTDNGSGMTDEVLKRVFTYGFTTKPPGRGSGMGLYMCKYIIELHGGGMRVSSKLGEGTTFRLTLPVFEETSSSAVGSISHSA
jgi:signal transduction histidine kinase